MSLPRWNRPPGAAAIPPHYLALHDYLRTRFADTVVLTFTQMEDLLGARLPDPARQEAAWWAEADAQGRPSPQAECWLQAGRSASPRLAASTVAFERAPLPIRG